MPATEREVREALEHTQAELSKVRAELALTHARQVSGLQEQVAQAGALNERLAELLTAARAECRVLQARLETLQHERAPVTFWWATPAMVLALLTCVIVLLLLVPWFGNS